MTALSLLAVSNVFAASVETLLMPGKVTRAHVKQEETCGNCHDRTNVRSQSSLCLDCHKDIASDVREHLRFHGRMTNSGVGECRACHTEHKGREADIVQLDRARFDHASTDFALEGAHSALECGSCHKKGEAWRKAPATCVGCHKADDVHRGQLTQPCGECHSSLELERRKVRSRQDGVQADGSAPHRDLQCLSHRRALQGDAEELRRLSRDGR